MEYVPGLDLSTLVSRSGPLAIADACEITRQAALGLDFAHRRGIIHRDVKPSNLLLCSTGQVKLLDLGLVVIQDDRHAAPGDGAALGTADYMSPEQWLDASRVELATDLYGLGCTLFKLLTGHAPYARSATTVVAKRNAHLHQDIPAMRSLRADVPAPLQRTIERLMAKDPAGRHGSARELADELVPLAAGANLAGLAKHYSQQDSEEPDASAYGDPVGAPASTASRSMNRRVAVVGLASAAAAFALYGWLGRDNGRRRLDQRWRTLSPTQTSTFAKLDPTATVDHDAQGVTTTVTTSDEMLVELGSPIQASFDLATTLRQERWDHPAGVFFKGRSQTSLEGETHLFECILLSSDPGSASHRLVWSSCRRHVHQGQVERDDQLLGQVAVDAKPGVDQQVLQVSVGRTRFPEVTWNGVKLPESRWNLSWDARQTREALPQRREIEYLGRLGVMVRDGTTTFQQLALRYVEAGS
jgi:hypothetical protein